VSKNNISRTLYKYYNKAQAYYDSIKNNSGCINGFSVSSCCNSVGMCFMAHHKSDESLVTFELESILDR